MWPCAVFEHIKMENKIRTIFTQFFYMAGIVGFLFKLFEVDFEKIRVRVQGDMCYCCCVLIVVWFLKWLIAFTCTGIYKTIVLWMLLYRMLLNSAIAMYVLQMIFLVPPFKEEPVMVIKAAEKDIEKFRKVLIYLSSDTNNLHCPFSWNFFIQWLQICQKNNHFLSSNSSFCYKQLVKQIYKLNLLQKVQQLF